MRINQLRTREVRAPRLNSWPADEPLLAGLNEAVRRASRTGQVNGFARAFIIALGASLFLLWWTLPEGLWSLESETAGASWANGVYLGMILLTMLLMLTLAQLFDTQTAALDILHALADHPLGDAFAGLPKELAPSGLWTRGSNRQPFQSCAHSVKRLRVIPDAAAKCPEAERLLSAALARSAAGHRAKSEDVAALHTVLNNAAFDLYPALAAKWQKGETADVAAEEFVALRLGALLRHLVMQMRCGIEYLSLGLVLLILSVIAYPFEPQKGLVYMVASVVAATGFIVVYAVTRIDSHPVMQKFASHEGAPSFLETVRKVAGLGLPPTIATFSALFPGSVRSLSTLIAGVSKYVGAQ